MFLVTTKQWISLWCFIHSYHCTLLIFSPSFVLALFLFQIFIHNISFEKPYICRKVEGRVLFFTSKDLLPDMIFLHLSSRYRLMCFDLGYFFLNYLELDIDTLHILLGYFYLWEEPKLKICLQMNPTLA